MSRKEKNITLTEELVLSKTKCASLDEVKTLNLWGLCIENVDVIQKMPNIETIALSTNHIHTLRPFACCPNLKELYVRRNRIENLQEIQYLKNLKNLKILWLSDNPISEYSDYRSYVIKTLPQVTHLDEMDVTDEERAAASRVSTPQVHVSQVSGGFQANLLDAASTLLKELTEEQKADLRYEITKMLSQ